MELKEIFREIHEKIFGELSRGFFGRSLIGIAEGTDGKPLQKTL